MMAEVRLFDDGAAAMAVRAPNLALRDFLLEHGESCLSIRQLDYTSSLRPDVIEVQDHGIHLAAVHAWRF
jgi:hypothetical protein